MKKQIMVMGAGLAISAVTVIASMDITNAASAQGTKQNSVVRRIGGEEARAKLNQAERDGTITAAQKTAFETEVKALREERKAAISKTSTKEERQTERAKLKTELQSWATTNNFPLAKIFPNLAS